MKHDFISGAERSRRRRQRGIELPIEEELRRVRAIHIEAPNGCSVTVERLAHLELQGSRLVALAAPNYESAFPRPFN